MCTFRSHRGMAHPPGGWILVGADDLGQPPVFEAVPFSWRCAARRALLRRPVPCAAVFALCLSLLVALEWGGTLLWCIRDGGGLWRPALAVTVVLGAARVCSPSRAPSLCCAVSLLLSWSTLSPALSLTRGGLRQGFMSNPSLAALAAAEMLTVLATSLEEDAEVWRIRESSWRSEERGRRKRDPRRAAPAMRGASRLLLIAAAGAWAMEQLAGRGGERQRAARALFAGYYLSPALAREARRYMLEEAYLVAVAPLRCGRVYDRFAAVALRVGCRVVTRHGNWLRGAIPSRRESLLLGAARAYGPLLPPLWLLGHLAASSCEDFESHVGLLVCAVLFPRVLFWSTPAEGGPRGAARLTQLIPLGYDYMPGGRRRLERPLCCLALWARVRSSL